jgi:protein-export membrane protein SecD
MLHFTRLQSLAIIFSVLLGLLYALPNAVPPAAQSVLAHFGAKPMTLGLDLQGGSNVVMEVDKADMKTQLLNQLASDIRNTLREKKIGYNAITTTPTGITVRLADGADQDAAKQALRGLLQPVSSGLLGGAAGNNLYELASTPDGQYAFSFSEVGLNEKVANALSQAVKILNNRINALGTTEASVQQQGLDRVVIQLPGVQDPEIIKNVIGKTAKLTLQLLCNEQPTAEGQKPPQDCIALPFKGQPQHIAWVQTASRATVDGADLIDAQPSFDQYNKPVVSFKLNLNGSRRFGKLTSENVDKPFAIILDKEIQSAPNINEPILGGSAQISGNFTSEETTNLAITLRSGALPAKLTSVEERTVGPSLGSDSIKAGFNAAIIGLLLVMVFMVVAYGLFGVFANIALLINLTLLIAVMSVVGFTLTLPGIAGIVLTMGMAVDSNVIIFERIREEWRNGRSALSSIDTGFKAALATILDSNLTALIAAIVLFGVGSGPVRGFAITHAIGIMSTMYTAYTVTRFIVILWARWAKPKEVLL